MRPDASTYLPVASNGTISPSVREYPSAVPHDTQTEFSKNRGLLQTRHRYDFTP
jgi:hypothetical protein